jgi:hypothetical protein
MAACDHTTRMALGTTDASHHRHGTRLGASDLSCLFFLYHFISGIGFFNFPRPVLMGEILMTGICVFACVCVCVCVCMF